MFNLPTHHQNSKCPPIKTTLVSTAVCVPKGDLPRWVVCVCCVVSLHGHASMVSPTLSAAAPSPVLWVGRFDAGLGPWQEVFLSSGLRPNTFRVRAWDGAAAVEVLSDASMSLLARPVVMNMNATPVLCWRWRIKATISQADMRRKDGDDYAARVYVSFKLPESSMGFGLRAKLALARAIYGKDLPDAAINYVWDNLQPKGTERANAYTDRAQMLVLRSGDADAGRWVWERRNVKQDVVRLFGEGARVVQLALTADTDNTLQSAQAGFADFHFVPATSPCEASR
jgi:hypothetical protein